MKRSNAFSGFFQESIEKYQLSNPEIVILSLCALGWSQREISMNAELDGSHARNTISRLHKKFNTDEELDRRDLVYKAITNSVPHPPFLLVYYSVDQIEYLNSLRPLQRKIIRLSHAYTYGQIGSLLHYSERSIRNEASFALHKLDLCNMTQGVVLHHLYRLTQTFDSSSFLFKNSASAQ